MDFKLVRLYPRFFILTFTGTNLKFAVAKVVKKSDMKDHEQYTKFL